MSYQNVKKYSEMVEIDVRPYLFLDEALKKSCQLSFFIIYFLKKVLFKVSFQLKSSESS